MRDRCAVCDNEEAAWAEVNDLADVALAGDSDARHLLPRAIAHALEVRRW